MGIQHEAGGILALEGVEAVTKPDVFGDIGEISGVVDVFVIHASLIVPMRACGVAARSVW